MTPSLPDRLAEEAAAFPASSYSANRVTLILGDGRRVREVFLAWGRDIVKVGNRAVACAGDLDFRVTAIVDVVSEAK